MYTDFDYRPQYVREMLYLEKRIFIRNLKTFKRKVS